MPAEREPIQAQYLIALNTLDETPERADKKAAAKSRETQNGYRQLRQELRSRTALSWPGCSHGNIERHRRILRVIFTRATSDNAVKPPLGAGPLRRMGFYIGSEYLSSPNASGHACGPANWRLPCGCIRSETGKSAATLDALVPRDLSAIPSDPFPMVSPSAIVCRKASASNGNCPSMPWWPSPSPTVSYQKDKASSGRSARKATTMAACGRASVSSPEPVGEDLLYLVPLPAK